MPSLISKRGQERYRASVTVKGISRQKLFPDKTKKSYRQAVVWENETRKALTEEISRTRSQSLRIGNWANEYLEDSRNRFVKQTFDEKRSVFKHFFKQSGIKPETVIDKDSIAVSGLIPDCLKKRLNTERFSSNVCFTNRFRESSRYSLAQLPIRKDCVQVRDISSINAFLVSLSQTTAWL